MSSNPDPLSIATEKTIMPPVSGKEPDIVTEKQDSSSEDAVVINGDVIKESDYTEEQYRKILKKIDRTLLPLMVCCRWLAGWRHSTELTLSSGSATASNKRTRLLWERKRSSA